VGPYVQQRGVRESQVVISKGDPPIKIKKYLLEPAWLTWRADLNERAKWLNERTTKQTRNRPSRLGRWRLNSGAHQPPSTCSHRTDARSPKYYSAFLLALHGRRPGTRQSPTQTAAKKKRRRRNTLHGKELIRSNASQAHFCSKKKSVWPMCSVGRRGGEFPVAFTARRSVNDGGGRAGYTLRRAFEHNRIKTTHHSTWPDLHFGPARPGPAPLAI